MNDENTHVERKPQHNDPAINIARFVFGDFNADN